MLQSMKSFCRRAAPFRSRVASRTRPCSECRPDPGTRRWHPARDQVPDDRVGQMDTARACRTANPMCKGTGRTRSRITTTGPTRRAAFLAIRSTRSTDDVRAKRARPSRVSDPVDGQVPFQPWARAVQQEFLANFHNPTKPEYIEPLARCAPAGVPKSFTWHGFEIRQYPQLRSDPVQLRFANHLISMASRTCPTT